MLQGPGVLTSTPGDVIWFFISSLAVGHRALWVAVFDLVRPQVLCVGLTHYKLRQSVRLGVKGEPLIHTHTSSLLRPISWRVRGFMVPKIACFKS